MDHLRYIVYCIWIMVATITAIPLHKNVTQISTPTATLISTPSPIITVSPTPSDPELIKTITNLFFHVASPSKISPSSQSPSSPPLSTVVPVSSADLQALQLPLTFLLGILSAIVGNLVIHLLVLVRDKRKEKLEQQKALADKEANEREKIRNSLMAGVSEFAIKFLNDDKDLTGGGRPIVNPLGCLLLLAVIYFLWNQLLSIIIIFLPMIICFLGAAIGDWLIITARRINSKQL